MNARKTRRTVRGMGVAAVVAASVVPTAIPAVAQTAGSTPPVTSRVDVDGDGRGDSTTLRLVSSRNDINRFVLTVRTAEGRTANLPLRIESYGVLKPREVWMGATGIDGVRGNEIVLDLGGGVGDFRWIHAYAWRNGKLVAVAAPGNARGDAAWHETFPPFPVVGYTFSMRGTTRYVVKHELNASKSGRSYSGWNTTYRWTTKGWSKVGRARTGVYSAATADKQFVGLHGLVWR